MLDLADHQDAAHTGLLEEGRKKGHLFFSRHILPTATAWPGALDLRRAARQDEAPAQLTGPADRHTSRLRGLRERQPEFQR
jgi:hypothetical protein